jgi:hypothetical protein
VFLKTFYVLVFLHIQTRRILGVGVSANPDGPWVTQQARNLVMDLAEDSDLRVRFLLRDRDAKYCRGFDAVFSTEGIRGRTHAVPNPTGQRPRRATDRKPAAGGPRSRVDPRSKTPVGGLG